MKRTVENKASDIQQIQKYLNGELDARAMHKLERRAQDDPFLMDALEGYGAAKADQQDNLAALQEQLEARTVTKVRRITPWVVTAIAASVIGFAVVVGLLYNNTSGDKQAQPQVAMNQPVKAVPADTTPVKIEKQAQQAIITPGKQVIASNKTVPARQFAPVGTQRKINAPAPLQEVTLANSSASKSEPSVSPLEEMVGSDIIASKRQDTVLGGEFVAINKNASQLNVLKSKAEGASMTTRPGKGTENNPTALANAGLPPNLLSGAVINRKDALPLPDASGKAPATPNGAGQGNAYGYTSPDIKKDAGVLVNNNAIGTKSFRGRDSAAQDKNNSALSEVVVVSTNVTTKTTYAHPSVGWDSYKKYLQQNAVSADGKVGVVELKVTINFNGTIVSVVVTKSLNAVADAKGITLVQNGPTWIGSASGKAEDVKVRVAFHK